MRAASALVSCWAAVCVSAALGGAASELTTIPPIVLAATGIALGWIASRPGKDCMTASVDRRALSALTCCGAAFGIALCALHAAPPGPVTTHFPGGTQTGDLFALLDRLDRDPDSAVGVRAAVSGIWTPASGDALATVARRVMSCCTADAVSVGFDVVPRDRVKLAAGAWVRVEGVVTRRMRDGETRYVLEQSRVTRLEDVR